MRGASRNIEQASYRSSGGNLSGVDTSGTKPSKDVGADGHTFGPEMRCPCGKTFFKHQEDPIPCTREGAKK